MASSKAPSTELWVASFIPQGKYVCSFVIAVGFVFRLQISDKVVVTCRGGNPGKKLKTIIEYKDEVSRRRAKV